ncbi:MAG: PAS domain S-box protein [Armatimonadetes bacterium]|nr:PAS domain S-box protein [Armatimonadota bacterium]
MNDIEIKNFKKKYSSFKRISLFFVILFWAIICIFCYLYLFSKSENVNFWEFTELQNRLFQPQKDLLIICGTLFVFGTFAIILIISVFSIPLKKHNKKLLNVLEESKLQLHKFLDKIPISVSIINEKGAFEYVNRTYSQLFKYPPIGLIGKSFTITIPEEHRDIFLQKHIEFMNGKIKERGEWKMHTKDEEILTLWVESIIIKGNNDKNKKLTFLHDITQRKLIEEYFMESEAKFRNFINFSEDGIALTNETGKIIEWNRGMNVITGINASNAIDNQIEDIKFKDKNGELLIPEIFQSDQIQKIKNEDDMKSPEEELTIVKPDKTEVIIQISLFPIIADKGCRFGIIIRDITKQELYESELRKTQKLESIGVLAGGIAHDFNNFLTAIVYSIGFAKLNSKSDTKVFQVLTDAEKAIFQAKNLTRHLLTFSEGGAPVKKITSVHDLIKDAVNFSLMGSNIKCEYSIQEELWNAIIDEGQINQVINNFVFNAKDAMSDGGILKVIAENSIIDEKYDFPIKKGNYIKISIKDEGIGIPEDILEKIYDPFFTTKEKGTGLGLASTYSIIKKHDGYITVDSKINVGTEFSIYLPASLEKIAPKKETNETKEKQFAGKEKILLMDDDEIILDLATETLSLFGYTVECAKDGKEAIEKYIIAKDAGKVFDFVIMDLTIPGGMGGKEAIQELLKIDPEICAIVSSGYSNDTTMANYKEFGFKGVIAKPYKIEELTDLFQHIMTKNKGKK